MPRDPISMDLTAAYPPFHFDARRRARICAYGRRLIHSILQMMYVSGETAEPPVETTSIMEDIVRQQVIEMVSSPLDTETAARGGRPELTQN
jgi:hypothetical protein